MATSPSCGRDWSVNGSTDSHSRIVRTVKLPLSPVELFEELRVPQSPYGPHALGHLLRVGGDLDLSRVNPRWCHTVDTTAIAATVRRPEIVCRGAAAFPVGVARGSHSTPFAFFQR